MDLVKRQARVMDHLKAVVDSEEVKGVDSVAKLHQLHTVHLNNSNKQASNSKIQAHAQAKFV